MRPASIRALLTVWVPQLYKRIGSIPASGRRRWYFPGGPLRRGGLGDQRSGLQQMDRVLQDRIEDPANTRSIVATEPEWRGDLRVRPNPKRRRASAPFLTRQRSHMLEMAQAFVIASTTDAQTTGDPPRALWVVLADTPHLAVEAARASGCKVDRIVGTLSEETVERLGIQPDQPRRL